MIDKNQVMFDIERCICHVPDACRDCSRYKGVDGLRCMEELMTDAIALLKEQEAVTEYVIDVDQPTCKACGFRPFAGYIPSLEWMRERGFKFCPQCGREVKWE